ncbi:hypothetical protein B484DRAFT_420157, partial [Ochromonadaceae sp. CCMP2298]
MNGRITNNSSNNSNNSSNSSNNNSPPEYRYRWLATTPSTNLRAPPAVSLAGAGWGAGGGGGWGGGAGFVGGAGAGLGAGAGGARLPPPEGRFSHAACLAVTRMSTHSRLIVFGGVSYNPDAQRLLSLRVNSTQGPEEAYLHWESVVCRSASPPNRQGHSLTLIPGEDILILAGGSRIQGGAAASCFGDLWVLRLHGVTVSR